MNESELQAYLDELPQKEFEQILMRLDDVYFNCSEEEVAECCVSDALYDQMKRFYEKKFERDYSAVGALPRAGNDKIKIRLSEWAPSLKKATDESEFKARRNKLFAVHAKKSCIANKVDGESARIYVRKPQTDYFITTRGNGKVGLDICHILPYVRDRLPSLESLQAAGISSIRCELVIKKSDFARLKANPPTTLRATNKLTNARNVLVGQVNAKTAGCAEILSLISIIAYEVKYEDPLNSNRFSTWTQMQQLQQLGFETPNPIMHEKIEEYDYKQLCKLLLERETETDYEIDGLVEYAEDYDVKLDNFDDGGFHGPPAIVSDAEAIQLSAKDCECPDIAFAIKLSSSEMKLRGKLTTVVRNVWQVSRFGRLTPVVWVIPIVIDGKTIEHPTGKTAKLMKDNKVGKGSQVKVVFGGGVIADITEFVTPSESGEADFPEDIQYVWTKTGEHIYLKDVEGSEEVKLQQKYFFFAELKCKDVGDKTIAQLSNYYGGDLARILKCTIEEVLTLPGFQIAKATNTVTSIQACLKNVTLVKAMYASSVFGESLGPSRLQDIVDSFPDVFQWQVTDNVKHLLVEKLQNIRGLKTLATQFVDQLTAFQEWVRKHPMIEIVELMPNYQQQAKQHISLYNLPNFVVFTGFTNPEWQKKIEMNGGKVQSSVSAKTEIVVTKVLGSGTSKELAAKKMNIRIMTLSEFAKTYEL